MSEYVIVTDSNGDMPEGFAAQNGVLELQLTYTIEGKSYQCHDPALSRHAFYEKMRNEQMPQTAAVNPSDAVDLLETVLQQGKDALCIMFSSALSTTYNSVCIAKQELAEKYPDCTVIVIDSLCASAGEGFLVARAVENKNNGLSIEENADKIRKDAPHITHLFTVNDLFHLHRGGRVSATAAVVGSVLGIKPVLHVDDSGRLVPVNKVRGRKQSLLALVDSMEKQMDPEHCDCFAISHGDCLEEAQFVASEIGRRLGIKKHTIAYVGPTIGAHSGPGTVALFFYGKKR